MSCDMNLFHLSICSCILLAELQGYLILLEGEGGSLLVLVDPCISIFAASAANAAASRATRWFKNPRTAQVTAGADAPYSGRAGQCKLLVPPVRTLILQSHGHCTAGATHVGAASSRIL